MQKNNFYCQQVCVEKDFSIEEWNKGLAFCEDHNLPESERRKILDGENCLNQCSDCYLIVAKRQEETKRLISGMKSRTDWGYFSITISNKNLSDLMYAILITNSKLVSTFHLGLERYSRKQNSGNKVDFVVGFQPEKQLIFEELAGVKLKSSEEFQGEMNVLK